jgi:uncharacterized protein (DUF302 family)
LSPAKKAGRPWSLWPPVKNPFGVAISCFYHLGPDDAAEGAQAMAVQGLTTIKSGHPPQETMSRLEAAVKAKGLTVFARIDHAEGASTAGLTLRPTEVLIFGNAKGGTPLMQAVQTIGIDLPLKALVWQDAAGETWLSWNDPAWLAIRHGLSGVETVVGRLAALLEDVAKTATTA